MDATNTNKLFEPIYVTKRNGGKEKADFSKVDQRLNWLNSYPYQLSCNASFVAQKVRDEITDGIDTKILDEYAAKVSAEFGAYNPEFLTLAMRISVSNHQKNTSDCFSNCVEACYRNKKTNGRPAPRVNPKFYKFVRIHKTALNQMMVYDRDYLFTDFGFSVLQQKYFLKRSGPRNEITARPQDFSLERPQDLWMRVSIAIHMNRSDLEDTSVLTEIKESYDLLSLGKIMHATPTLFNAGTLCEQYLSCFIMGGDDSINGIGKIIADAMEISKYSGGIGFWWDLRSAGSEVQSTNGTSDGPIPFLGIMERAMIAVNQGGKRAGSAANYMEPTHPQFMQWLRLKRAGETGSLDKLFYGVWTSDEFMRRVEADEFHYFVDPHDHQLLSNLYDSKDNLQYSKEYNRIIAAKEYVGEPIKARTVMAEICRSQCETGTPYILFKDAANAKSNQQNIGTIKSSNLCVAGDTPILTSNGWYNIDALVDQVVPVWNGYEFSDALVKQTSESADLLEIETSDGCILRCTPLHEFIVHKDQQTVKVPANTLLVGQKLAKIPLLPVIDNGDSMCSSDELFVPINYNLKSKLEWLAELIDDDVALIAGKIRIINDRDFLLDIKLMCQTIGINPIISKLHDVRGRNKFCTSEICYYLTISELDTWKLYNELGMVTHSMQYNVTVKPNCESCAFITISSITKLDVPEKTYCFGEPKRNQGMFCGLLTGQCGEILEYSSPEEYACCCVSSLCLPKFVIPCDCTAGFACPAGDIEGHQQGCNGKTRIDYDDMAYCAGALTRNLNKIININFYPVPEARRSNLRHRPLAIGVQGWADELLLQKYPFTSKLARAENKRTFESIYWGAIKASNELAAIDGAYDSYLGDELNNPMNPNEPSQFAQGKLQFDLWGLKNDDLMGRWDWTSMRQKIAQFGMRNSLLTSLPPTATTSQIQGNNECLHGDTPVLTTSGMSIQIKEFEDRDTTVIGWNGNAMNAAIQSNKLNQKIQKTIELMFLDGRKIICTKDHKFLKSNGEWIEAQNIKATDQLIAGIDGTVDKIGDDELEFDLDADTLVFGMRSPIARKRTLAFARILGYVLTDGSIDIRKYQTCVDLYMGCMYDVDAISKDIELLEGKLPHVTDTGIVFRTRLHCKLSNAIASLKGIVSGKRSNHDASLPTFLLDPKCPVAIVREFLAGVMGGDGTMPFISKDSTIRPAILELSIHKDRIDTLRVMYGQFQQLFTRVGVINTFISGPFEKSGSNILGNPDVVKLRLTIPCGKDLMEFVGVRYCVSKLYRLSVATMYWRQKDTISQQRRQIIDDVLSKIGQASVPSLLQCAHDTVFGIDRKDRLSPMSSVSADDIKYYKKIGGYKPSNRSRSEMSPSDFIKSIGAEFVFQDYAVTRFGKDLPKFYTKLIGSRDAGMHQVWDISVDGVNSFLANGVMVHNCFEPYTSNIYVRKTNIGENIIINCHLVKDLQEQELWTPEIRAQLIKDQGSVQRMNIPDWIKELYKTAWELDGPSLIDMDAERGPFIDQTQSSNRFMLNPTTAKLIAMHLRAWRKGLKTGMYYLRSQSASKPQQFSATAATKKTPTCIATMIEGELVHECCI